MGLRQVWICGTMILHACMNSILLSPHECACVSRDAPIISANEPFSVCRLRCRLTSLIYFADTRMKMWGFCTLTRSDTSPRQKCPYQWLCSQTLVLDPYHYTLFVEISHHRYGSHHRLLPVSSCCIPRICTIDMHDSAASLRAAIRRYEHRLRLDSEINRLH